VLQPLTSQHKDVDEELECNAKADSKSDDDLESRIPSSLAAIFNKAKEARAVDETEQRVYRILEALPSRQQMASDPSLHALARRKPYTRML
jgi:hypothetical protein